jgi:hypothetical protein
MAQGKGPAAGTVGKGTRPAGTPISTPNPVKGLDSWK